MGSLFLIAPLWADNGINLSGALSSSICSYEMLREVVTVKKRERKNLPYISPAYVLLRRLSPSFYTAKKKEKKKSIWDVIELHLIIKPYRCWNEWTNWVAGWHNSRLPMQSLQRFQGFYPVKNWQADHHQTDYYIGITLNFLSAPSESLKLLCRVAPFIPRRNSIRAFIWR